MKKLSGSDRIHFEFSKEAQGNVHLERWDALPEIRAAFMVLVRGEIYWRIEIARGFVRRPYVYLINWWYYRGRKKDFKAFKNAAGITGWFTRDAWYKGRAKW